MSSPCSLVLDMGTQVCGGLCYSKGQGNLVIEEHPINPQEVDTSVFLSLHPPIPPHPHPSSSKWYHYILTRGLFQPPSTAAPKQTYPRKAPSLQTSEGPLHCSLAGSSAESFMTSSSCQFFPFCPLCASPMEHTHFAEQAALWS